MTFPAGLTPVTVRGKYLHIDGSPCQGRVHLTPVVTRPSSSLDLIIVAAPVIVNLDGAGAFNCTVSAGDDPDLGTPLYLKIEEKVSGQERTYTILVPTTAATLGLDLADASPLELVADMSAYVLVSSIGATNGVAPLVNNLVPAIHLPPSSGTGITDHGLLSGLADDDHPQYLTQLEGDARYPASVHSHPYDPSGTAASAVTTHAAAIDPHTGYVQPADLALVATTGIYNDLTAKPTIPSTFNDLTGTVPQSALDSDLATIAALAPVDGLLLRRISGAWAAAGLIKEDVGLGNVDNTSDLAKPISTITTQYVNNRTASSLDHGNAVSGVETCSRFNLADLSNPSGQLRISYFLSAKDITLGKLFVTVGSTAGSGITLARLALFIENADLSITKVAQTANDATMGIAAYSTFERALSTANGFPASYNVLGGVRYALGWLQVGTTPCVLSGRYVGNPYSAPPTRYVDNQTDIAASYTATAAIVHSQLIYLGGTA